MSSESLRLALERSALTIVDAVVDLPPEESRARIDAACGTDTRLRERVLQLVAEVAGQTPELTSFHVVRLPGILTAPEKIGHFRIVDVIGQGGMGLVCKAERDDGLFEQTVAIKLLHPILRSEAAFEHFFRERKILARLSHPGIVGLLDGGDQDGRPYLIMPFVDGDPLTAYLRSRALRLTERLALFDAIVDAVIHAHRQLVVHADLKPSNILVDRQDQVRLLDFGIARLLGDEAMSQANVTAYTEGYAAPERLAGEPASVASDVYSLGVILYQMLCGRMPDTTTHPGNLLPPSRACKDPLVDPLELRGDLDAIVGRAMAPEPRQRYQDAAALQRDLQRHRRLLPVHAHPGGWRYLTGRFLRRNRRRLLLGGALVMAIIGAIAVSTTQYVQTTIARQEADRRFVEVRRLVHYLLFELYDKLADSPGTTEARAQVANTARQYLEELAGIRAPPEDLRLDVARSYIRLAAVLGLSGTSSLGRTAEADQSLHMAEGILINLANEHPTVDVLIETGNLLNSRWTLLADNAASDLSNTKAAQTFNRALQLEPGNQKALLGWLTTERNRGFGLLWTHDDPAAAAAVMTASIARLRNSEFEGQDMATAAGTLEIQMLARLGDAQYYTDDSTAALAAYREAEARTRARLAVRETPASLDQLGDLLFNISGVLSETPDLLEPALFTAREGISVMEKVLDYGPDASAEKRLLVLLGQEAAVLSALGRHGEALASSRRSIELRETRRNMAPDNPMRRRDLAIGLGAHVEVLLAAGMGEAACATAGQALQVWNEIETLGDLSPRDARHAFVAAQDRKARSCGDGTR